MRIPDPPPPGVVIDALPSRDPLDLGANLLWSWLTQVAKSGASEDDCLRVLLRFGYIDCDADLLPEQCRAVLVVAEAKGLIAYETRVAGRQVARFVVAVPRPGKTG